MSPAVWNCSWASIPPQHKKKYVRNIHTHKLISCCSKPAIAVQMNVVFIAKWREKGNGEKSMRRRKTETENVNERNNLEHHRRRSEARTHNTLQHKSDDMFEHWNDELWWRLRNEFSANSEATTARLMKIANYEFYSNSLLRRFPDPMFHNFARSSVTESGLTRASSLAGSNSWFHNSSSSSLVHVLLTFKHFVCFVASIEKWEENNWGKRIELKVSVSVCFSSRPEMEINFHQTLTFLSFRKKKKEMSRNSIWMKIKIRKLKAIVHRDTRFYSLTMTNPTPPVSNPINPSMFWYTSNNFTLSSRCDVLALLPRHWPRI